MALKEELETAKLTSEEASKCNQCTFVRHSMAILQGISGGKRSSLPPFSNFYPPELALNAPSSYTQQSVEVLPPQCFFINLDLSPLN